MKQIFFALFVCTLSLMGYAQNNKEKADDLDRIALATYLPHQTESMSESAKNMLANKLGQLASQCGLGGGASGSRFILTANVVVISKDVTPSAPPMIAQTIEVTLYIGDGIDGVKFSSHTITLKGVGENETKAYMNALKNLKTNDKEYHDFISQAKTKIIEFYNRRCDFILKEAHSLAGQSKYDAAISKLVGVPEVCKKCYDTCMNFSVNIYKQKMEHDCQSNIALAKTLKSQDKYFQAADLLSGILPNVSCYAEAQDMLKDINDHKCAMALGQAKGAWAAKDIAGTSNALKNIPSDSKCFDEASKLAEEVRAWVKEKDNREWDFHLKSHQDDLDIRMANISAMKEIGAAYGGNQPKDVEYNVKGWW